MDAEVVNIRESETRIPGGHAAPRAAGHEHCDKSENDSFQNSEGACKKKQRQGSATLKCTHRALPREILSFVLVGGTAEAGRHRDRRNYEISEEVHTRKKRSWYLSWYTHKEHSTPCSAHHSNGTLIDRRNGQKGMLGTRIIHVLYPLWQSLFAAMVRENGSRKGRAFLAKVARVLPGTKKKERCWHNDVWAGT